MDNKYKCCIVKCIMKKTTKKHPFITLNKVSCHGDSPEHPLRTYTLPNLDLLPQLKMIAGITQQETSKFSPNISNFN